MADETNWEALLKEGANPWNEWRKQHPDDKPRKLVLASVGITFDPGSVHDDLRHASCRRRRTRDSDNRSSVNR